MIKAYQLKITLKGSKPSIWRRCIVPASITFQDLRHIFAAVMGWEDYHLANFEFPSLKLLVELNLNDIGDPLEPYPPYRKALDERITVIDPLMESCKWFYYIYDFGDNWEHRVDVEKVLMDYDRNYPHVVEYSGDCPPEDSGGIYGYYEKQEILENPGDPRYEEVYEWCSGDLVIPYDMEAVNEFLKGYTVLLVTGESLIEALECYNREVLKKIAQKLNVRGYLQLKREELAAFLAEKLVDTTVAKKYFLASTPEEWKVFVKLNNEIIGNAYDMETGGIDFKDLNYWLEGSYLFLSSTKQILIPEEVKECFSKVCTEQFFQKHERIHLLVDYIKASVNLYGIVEKDKVIEIFNSQNQAAASEKELERAVKAVKRKGYLFPFCSVGKYYALDIYEYDAAEMDMEETLAQQEGKPYYIPEKSRFLKYADQDYFEKTKEYRKFREYLLDMLSLDEEVLDNICMDVVLDLRQGVSVDSELEDLMGGPVTIGRTLQRQELADLLRKLARHVRMTVNRGYTPAELTRMDSGRGKIIPFEKKKKT